MVAGQGGQLPTQILEATYALVTGKYFSKALILASVNPNYDERLLWNDKKNSSSDHVVSKTCAFVMTFRTIF